MKAIVFKKPLSVTDSKMLELIDVPKPVATGRDMLVKIEAVSMNPVDYKIRKGGNLGGSDYRILGWDAAGVIEAVGESVEWFKPGDKVFYAGEITRAGSNAEYQLVDERVVGKMPATLNFTQAAALPLTAITAWELLFDRLKVEKNSEKTLLVVGGAGGVGSILIQLAKTLTKLKVIATASRAETQAWVKKLGADQVIDHKKSFAAQIGENSVDYAVSLTHSSTHMTALAEVIKPQGQLGVIDNADNMNVMPLQYKSISFHWELMFTRSLYKTHDLAEQHKLLNAVADLVDAGKIKTTLAKNLGKMTVESLREAHAIAESGTAMGKLVLESL